MKYGAKFLYEIFTKNFMSSFLAGEHVRLTVTEIFAEQLVSQENFHRAALYYLACHQEYKAINMFQTAGMYRYDPFHLSV